MYDYFQEGVTLEYTHYNKKGKVEMVNTQKVTGISHVADTLVATITTKMVNEKGKEMYQGGFPMKCHAGTIYMDMRSMAPPQQASGQSDDMKVQIRSTDQVYPADMKVGQSLPDAEMEMTMSLGALQIMSTQYFIKNRKVEAEESVTTAAGTYKCLKISYDFEYKLMGTRTNHTVQWYAGSVGMVKSISYDKKGEEESRMELSKFVK